MATLQEVIRRITIFRRSRFGEGRVVKDKQAVKLGMADGVGTLDETLRRLSAGQPAVTRTNVASMDDFRRRRQAHRARAGEPV